MNRIFQDDLYTLNLKKKKDLLAAQRLLTSPLIGTAYLILTHGNPWEGMGYKKT